MKMKRIEKGETQRERQKRKKEEDNCVGESKRSNRGSLNVCVFSKMPS